MNLLLSFASAHGLCFIRLPLSSPMNFLPSYFSPSPNLLRRGRAPGTHLGSIHHKFSLFKLFKPRGPSEPTPHSAKTSQGQSEQRHVWLALICSSMTHICIQLGWLQIICGWAKNTACTHQCDPHRDSLCSFLRVHYLHKFSFYSAALRECIICCI